MDGRVPIGRQARLILALPGFEWLGAAEPYPDRHFPELTVKLEDANARVTETVKVGYRGADITGTVRAAGLDPFAIADTPPFVELPAATQSAAQDLIGSGPWPRTATIFSRAGPPRAPCTWTFRRATGIR